MSRHKRMRVGGKPTDLLEVLGEVETESFEDVFIFGGRRKIRWKNMRKNKPTLFSFRFCCFTLFSFSVFAIVRQENVTYGLVCYGLSRWLSPSQSELNEVQAVKIAASKQVQSRCECVCVCVHLHQCRTATPARIYGCGQASENKSQIPLDFPAK